MDAAEIHASVAARPATESLQESFAQAAYAAALAAQQAGKPGSVVAGILTAYAAEWRTMRDTLESV
ncbi:hypothetical protein [Agromyces sp. H66]|uniref:hypothetical protein n=1 Tax=Agromyces sp. H66 TaxID=2529859 RepID=UPI0010AAC3A0|nr:hypothetical protein [Agromyces sp. H66]